jgi:hypothetical protein
MKHSDELWQIGIAAAIGLIVIIIGFLIGKS